MCRSKTRRNSICSEKSFPATRYKAYAKTNASPYLSVLCCQNLGEASVVAKAMAVLFLVPPVVHHLESRDPSHFTAAPDLRTLTNSVPCAVPTLRHVSRCPPALPRLRVQPSLNSLSAGGSARVALCALLSSRTPSSPRGPLFLIFQFFSHRQAVTLFTFLFDS